MSFSIYSFLNAVFWFNVILIPIAILQLRGNAAKHYRPVLLAALAILAAVRVFLPVDSSMFLVIRSYHVLRFLQQVLKYRVFDLVPVWEVAVMIWIAGALTVFIREMYLCQRDRRTRQSWVHVHNERVVCAATALEIPLERIVVTPKVGVPMAAGLFHPQIYLPDADLTIEEWTWVLKHEQMHLKKGDIWFKLLYLVLEGLFFWNPLMPMIEDNLSDLLEFRCDYFVTRNCTDDEKRAYLLAILHILQHAKAKEEAEKRPRKSHSHMCTFMVANDAERLLRDRVDAVENPRPKRPFLHTAIAVVSVILFLASYFILFQPATDPPVFAEDGYVEITPENAYIVHTADGKYEVWVDGELFSTISEEVLNADPMNKLTVYEEGSKIP